MKVYNCEGEVFIIIVMISLYIYPFKPSRYIEASFHIPENSLNFPTTKDFRM